VEEEDDTDFDENEDKMVQMDWGQQVSDAEKMVLTTLRSIISQMANFYELWTTKMTHLKQKRAACRRNLPASMTRMSNQHSLLQPPSSALENSFQQQRLSGAMSRQLKPSAQESVLRSEPRPQLPLSLCQPPSGASAQERG
jgi:hypothetical protein